MGRHWHDDLDVPEGVKELVPRGYDVIGDVVILRLPEEAHAYEDEVGQALLSGVPPANVAAVDEGVEGTVRSRSLRVIGGEHRLVTEHKENGCRLRVDLENAYFSPRLAHERARVADQVRPDEQVLDMYCGVGPYTVLVAKHAQRVIGVDVNPRAVALARENAAWNKVQDPVDVLVGDARRVVPALEARFDRVVMNLPHSAPEHVPKALPRLEDEGVIHLGAMLPKDHADEQAQAIADEHDVELLDLVNVRPYNPAVAHYTLDLTR